MRAATGTSDRGHTAASQLQPGQIDWEHLFGELGVRWFHTGGIFAALSETTSAVIREALQVARKHGTICSYDLNFRNSLWKDYGGQAACQKVNREIAPLVDVMIQIDQSKSLVYNAACAIDTEPDKAAQLAHVAKASASETAAFASGRSVQYHGGIGFTWECYVHLYFKRQKHSQLLFGDAVWHRARLADILLGEVA